MKSLAEKLKGKGFLKKESLERAFLKIRRDEFVPSKLRHLASKDKPLPIGCDQTISQPSVVAFMLELMDLEKGDKVLDIGSGSGWTTALIAEIVGSSGEVVAIERISQLHEFGKENVGKFGFIDEGRVDMILGNGLEKDFEDEYFNGILVSAALKDGEVPEKWLNQLKEGGILVVPLKNSIYKYTKTRDDFVEEKFPGFRFVPLITKDE